MGPLMTLDDAISLVFGAPEGLAVDAYNKVAAEYDQDDADLVLPWLAEGAILIDTEADLSDR